MLRGGVILMGLLLGLLLVPGVAACSFFVTPEGGLDVRVHDIRSGNFGFGGDVEYTVYMGDEAGTYYEWGGPFASDGYVEPFIHTYDQGGQYEVTLECRYVDDGSIDTYVDYVTVGGFLGPGGLFGIPWMVWGAILIGAMVIPIATKAKQRKREPEGDDEVQLERLMQPARGRTISTKGQRRKMGCFPAEGDHPTPLPSGKGHTYEASLPAGETPALDSLESEWHGDDLRLQWMPPGLPPDAALTGYRLYEHRSKGGWVHRDNLAPDTTELDIDHSDAEGGPYQITGYEVRPVFEVGGGSPQEGRGASITL